jgi:YHS domain-containing protein
MVIDPVCQIEVDERIAEFKSSQNGEHYYFCSLECKEVFDDNPGRVHGGSVVKHNASPSTGKHGLMGTAEQAAPFQNYL